MAEALFRELGGERVAVESAGSHPAGPVNPRTLARRSTRPASTTAGPARSPMTEFLGQPFDYVITVCDDAAEELPVLPGPRRVGPTGASRTRPARPGRTRQQLAVYRATLADLRGTDQPRSSLRSTDEPATDPTRPSSTCCDTPTRAIRRTGRATTRTRPLSQKGEAQAERLATFLARHPVPRGRPDQLAEGPRAAAPPRSSPTVWAPTVRIDERLGGAFEPTTVDAILADAGAPKRAGPRRPRPGLQRAGLDAGRGARRRDEEGRVRSGSTSAARSSRSAARSAGSSRPTSWIATAADAPRFEGDPRAPRRMSMPLATRVHVRPPCGRAEDRDRPPQP